MAGKEGWTGGSWGDSPIQGWIHAYDDQRNILLGGKKCPLFGDVHKIKDVNNLTVFMNKAIATQLLMTHCLLMETP